MFLDGEDPAHGDPLARPAQNLADPDRQQIAVVQQIGNLGAVPGDPVGDAMQARLGVSFPERVAESVGLPDRQGNRGRASARPVDAVDLADLPLELTQLRLEVRPRLPAVDAAAFLLGLAPVVGAHEFGEQRGAGPPRRVIPVIHPTRRRRYLCCACFCLAHCTSPRIERPREQPQCNRSTVHTTV